MTPFVTTRGLSSTVYAMTQGYRGVLYLVKTAAKAQGSDSADVREMLGEHSMTKTDGLKNRSS